MYSAKVIRWLGAAAIEAAIKLRKALSSGDADGSGFCLELKELCIIHKIKGACHQTPLIPPLKLKILA
jgi:hypothetical protein